MDSIVETQDQKFSDLEAEIAELEAKAFPTEEVADPTEAADTAKAADSTEVDTQQVDTQGSDSEGTDAAKEPVTEEEVVEKPPRTEMETLDKRWRDGVKWNTALNTTNITLKKQVDTLTGQLKGLKTKLETAPDTPSAKMKAMHEDYPDMMGILEPAIAEMMDAQKTSYQGQIDELKTLMSDRQIQADREEVLRYHPDLDAIAESPRFKDWMSRDTNIASGQKYHFAESGTNRDLVMLFSQFKREANAEAKVKDTPAKPPKQDNAAKEKQTLKKSAAEATIEPRVRKTNPFMMGTTPLKKMTVNQLDALSMEDFEKLTDGDLKEIQQSLASTALV